MTKSSCLYDSSCGAKERRSEGAKERRSEGVGHRMRVSRLSFFFEKDDGAPRRALAHQRDAISDNAFILMKHLSHVRWLWSKNNHVLKYFYFITNCSLWRLNFFVVVFGASLGKGWHVYESSRTAGIAAYRSSYTIAVYEKNNKMMMVMRVLM